MAKKIDPLTEDGPRVLGNQEQAAERRRRDPRERQHPALYGEPGVEVAERTPDTDTDSADEFVKDFVTLRRDYEGADRDAVHARNINAVRQYMMNYGLRPDSDVVFEGEHDHWDGASVVLRYRVPAIPAVVATSFDTRHAVVVQDGPTPTERAEHDAKREERLKAGWDAKRTGTPEADRPHAKASKGESKEG